MAVLEIRDLTHYFGGLCALSHLDITLEPGTLTGLIGPNGAGKTTVFNLVSGFYRPSRGEIRFAGRNIAGLKPHQVTALGVARTFQNIRLWKDLTVLDNIRIAQHHRLGYGFADAVLRTRRFRRREAEIDAYARELLEVLELGHVAGELPKNLPYGLQRKVELARALSVEPKLLLLDEPAAGLNTTDVEELIRHIRWIRDRFDVTIWMIEHHMDVVMELCSHITVIDFGQTIASGTPEEIRTNPAVIQAYLGDDEI
ncbi:ABC transporter ATP-binding protein [Deferrisoma camini]|uniref:ABC transporter ATP-binding protein n=1 Tax=Deferrisoma camini TaxID=1035120 RepID=UPI00046CAFB1|nr:ABC transporter ATP-binding protein [Deferrisoma camini]